MRRLEILDRAQGANRVRVTITDERITLKFPNVSGEIKTKVITGVTSFANQNKTLPTLRGSVDKDFRYIKLEAKGGKTFNVAI